MEKKKEVSRVMIVDDVAVNVEILEEIIKSMGYEPMSALSASQVFELLRKTLPQLILLDISMPEMNGYELCTVLKQHALTKDIPIIFISAMDSSDDKVKGFRVGGVDFITKPFEPTEVKMRVENHLKIYEMQLELEQYNSKLNRMVTEQMNRIEQTQKNILYALAKLTEGRDNMTGNHLDNIGYNSRILAQSLQFSPLFEKEISESFIQTIGMASLLHDIGKIRMPDDILLKPGALTGKERKIMEEHSEIGAVILEEIYASTEKNEFLPMAINIARYHHERWDGTGYPTGAKGLQIPLEARIVCVLDSYDTLTGERCYKKPYSSQESGEIILEGRGSFFDPDIVDVFLKVRRQLKCNEAV